MAIITTYPVDPSPATGDYLVGSKITSAGAQINPTKNFTIGSVVEAGLGYTQYTCLVSQNGVNDPIAEDLKNNTGATMTWNRIGPGIYRCNASSPIFTSNKTIVFVNVGTSPNGPGAFVEWNHDVSYVEINIYDIAGAAADDLLDNGAFEIRIYS